MMRYLAIAMVAALLTAPASGQESPSPSSADRYQASPAVEQNHATHALQDEAALQWSPREWRVNVSELLAEQARSEGAAKHALTRRLLAVYSTLPQGELSARDQRMLAGKLEHRLLRARQEMLEAQEEAATAQPANVNVKPGEGQLADNGILGQFGNFIGQQFGGGQFGAPRNAQVDDEGEELVDLIETTIAPESWDSRGGNGTIVYWGNLKVLVVRNTRDVHEQLQDLGDALRKAGN